MSGGWPTRPDDWIEYGIGNPDHEGRTTVRVSGDGDALVASEAPGRQEYRGQLSADELAAFGATIAANDPRSLSSTRELGVPDEARIRIAIRSGGDEREVELWDNEQYELPALRALVDAFNRIAQRISGGAVQY